VWNATNLSRKQRAVVVGLAADYGVRIHIEYLEVGPSEQRRRNASRQRAVPESVVRRMLERWEVPDLTEAHEVRWNGQPAGW
jgi:predicted kinase